MPVALTPSKGGDFFHHGFIWSEVMPQAARISTSVPVPSLSRRSAPSENSDAAQFVAVALFSGIGLLVSLVAVIFGVQGVWL